MNSTYMIIERYKPGKSKEIYQRFAEEGRMLPEGLTFVNSWVEENLETCYQVMRSESIDLINLWIDQWNDLVDFQVIPVLTSEEAAKQSSL